MSSTSPMLSVILPAYQEAANLKDLLPRLKQTLESMAISYEVLIVDTIEPMDQTEELCESHEVRYLRRSPSNAFGDAYRTGIQETKGQLVLVMDADGSHPPEFISHLFSFTKDADVVIASRYVKGGSTENNAILELMSRVLNLTYSIVLGIRCRDMSNSFKIYDGERLRALDLRCENFDVVEEIMVGLARDGGPLRIREVPFTFREREKGRSKRNLFAFIFSYVFTLLRLRFRKWPTPKNQARSALKADEHAA